MKDNLSPLPSKTQTRKASAARAKEKVLEERTGRGGEWGVGGFPVRYDGAQDELDGIEDGGKIERSGSVIRARDSDLDRHRSSHGITTILSAVFTLVLLGVTSYFAYESIMYSGSEIAQPEGAVSLKGEDTLRLVQRIVLPVIASALVLIVFILRSRRLRKITTIFLLVLSFVAFLSHLSLTIANLTLTLLWNRTLANRCSWGVDVIWNLPSGSGESCDGSAGDQGMEWVIAGGVRIFITGCVGLLWMYMLIRWHHSLTKPSKLVLLHDAVLANRSTPGDLLPPMPTRILTTHYAHVSDATSFVPSVAPRSGGLSTWIGSRFWQGYGWVLGVDPYSSVERDSEDKGKNGGTQEKARESTREDSARLLVDQSDAGRRNNGGIDQASKYRQVDLDDPVFRRSSLDSDDEEVYHSPRESFHSPSFPPPISSNQATNYTPINYSNLHANQLEHGSSGSTNGAFVYVRMSDGKLVRKLSTIASVASDDLAGRGGLKGRDGSDTMMRGVMGGAY